MDEAATKRINRLKAALQRAEQAQKARGDGRTDESECTQDEETDFRSLVSGMAWVGLTSPLAMSAAFTVAAWGCWVPHVMLRCSIPKDGHIIGGLLIVLFVLHFTK